jgi:3-hydroxy-3-methylglutaryl CoA synthase
MSGILSFGAYVPKKRLKRSAIFAPHAWFAPGLAGMAKGERAIGDWDEDSITMAVEAARDGLSGIDRSTIGTVILASTTLPFADRQNAGIVKEALNLNDAVGTLDVGGSLRAATGALIQAFRAAEGGHGAAQLCLAADMRKSRPASEAELLNGDAAASVLVGRGEALANYLGSYSVSADFIDHHRATGADFDYGWEARWVRDEGHHGLLVSAIREGLARLGVAAEAIDRVIIPIDLRGVAASVAKKAGFRAETVVDTLGGQLGDSGAAHPLVLLVAALEAAQPGEKIVLVGFGHGVDVILLETTAALKQAGPRLGLGGHLPRRREDDNYMRWLFHREIIELETGMRAEADYKQYSAPLWRQRKAVLGLVGGRCTRTGTVQFPRSTISVNPNDHAHSTQEDYPLADRPARLVSFTADSLTYTPAPPFYYGLVDFDGGGRLKVEFADVDEGALDVGGEMEMVFRIKAFDKMRGFRKYFWKARPVTREA